MKQNVRALLDTSIPFIHLYSRRVVLLRVSVTANGRSKRVVTRAIDFLRLSGFHHGKNGFGASNTDKFLIIRNPFREFVSCCAAIQMWALCLVDGLTSWFDYGTLMRAQCLTSLGCAWLSKVACWIRLYRVDIDRGLWGMCLNAVTSQIEIAWLRQWLSCSSLALLQAPFLYI